MGTRIEEAYKDLEGKKALVLGLGVHGGALGVARFLAEHGAEVTVTDLRPESELAESLEALKDLDIRYVLGEHRPEDILSADFIVRNPAVPRESKWLELARENGIPVLMEMNLFWRYCPAPITAITGSKGKSTTTSWLGHISKLWHPDTVVAGNLRVSALSMLPQISEDTPVILELSSWQLEAFEVGGEAPHVSCITNISYDHLNRYPSFEAYYNSKRWIYRNQKTADYAVFNYDDPIVSRFVEDCLAQVRWFSRSSHVKPGGYIDNDYIYLVDETGSTRKLLQVHELQLPGEHNRMNALAAAVLASAMNIPDEFIVEGLRTFKGLPDRLELVSVIDGVKYINDTTSTVPASTIAALKAVEGEVVLLAGGASKNVPFDELADFICQKKVRVVLLEGSATADLQTAINKRCPELIVGTFSSLESALEAARDIARPGHTVLLSPACASFGMFRNEFHRGQLFKDLVHKMEGKGTQHG